MNTISELKAQNFAPFNGDAFREQVDAVKYIERMAGVTGAAIDKWDILECFRNPLSATGKVIITDKRSINKRLYELDKQAKDGVPVEGLSDQKEIKKISDLIFSEIETGRRAELSRSWKDALRSASNYTETAEQYRKNAFHYFKQLSALKNSESPEIQKEINAVIQNPFWEYKGIGENNDGHKFLKFHTRAEIVLTEKNPSAGIDISVNVGRFEAQLVPKTSMVRVFQAGNNVLAHGYWHPYISSAGGVCWGNASDTADELLASAKYGQAFALLAALLATYDSNTTPYMDLVNFHEASQRNLPEALRDDDYCADCSRHLDRCECEPETWECNDCGHTNAHDEEYCQNCYCTECGFRNFEHDAYCPNHPSSDEESPL